MIGIETVVRILRHFQYMQEIGADARIHLYDYYSLIIY